MEVALDYPSVGLDPAKTTHYSIGNTKLSELTMYYLNLITVAHLQRIKIIKPDAPNKLSADIQH